MTGLRDVARRIDRWWQRTRAAAAERSSLALLNDRELADIGLRGTGARCAGDRPWLDTLPS